MAGGAVYKLCILYKTANLTDIPMIVWYMADQINRDQPNFSIIFFPLERTKI